MSSLCKMYFFLFQDCPSGVMHQSATEQDDTIFSASSIERRNTDPGIPRAVDIIPAAPTEDTSQCRLHQHHAHHQPAAPTQDDGLFTINQFARLNRPLHFRQGRPQWHSALVFPRRKTYPRSKTHTPWPRHRPLHQSHWNLSRNRICRWASHLMGGPCNSLSSFLSYQPWLFFS